MNSNLNPGAVRKLIIISLVVLSLILLVFFKYYFSSTIILHTQAPDYGDIKFEIVDNTDANAIEKNNILINSKYRFYLKKIKKIPDNGKIRFYFDRRHRIFITKGILVIGKNLSLNWVGPKKLSNDIARNNVGKYSNTRFTSIFENFGDSAHFNIDIKNNSSKLITPGVLLLIGIGFICAVFIFLIGLLINKAILKIDFLQQHKLKLLAAAFLVILFLASGPLKSLLMICTVFWTSFYLIRYKAADALKHQGLIAGLFLGIIFTGFALQADLLKILKNEVQNSDSEIEFDFFQNFGNRFSKYFNFKKEIGHLNSQLKVDVFERSPTTKVIVGKNGTMFEGTGERRIEGDKIDFFDNVSDYLGRLPFHQGELDQWYTTIKQRNCWLKQQGIDYLFAIAPTKALVYPELLPDVLSQLKSTEKKSRIELLDQHLNQNQSLAFLNLTQPLVEAKSLHSDLNLFYRTDFHWNYIGAYYAYKAIIEMLSTSANLDIQAIPLDKFNIDVNPNWAHKSFLGLLGLLPKWYSNEQYIKLMPKADNPIINMEPYATEGVKDILIPTQNIPAKSGDDFVVEYIDNPNGEARTILVIGDSFIQKVFPLISAHASRNYFSRAVFEFPYEIINALKPDIVIQEILNMYLLRLPPTNPKAIHDAQCS